jgi:hypothetical protein
MIEPQYNAPKSIYCKAILGKGCPQSRGGYGRRMNCMYCVPTICIIQMLLNIHSYVIVKSMVMVTLISELHRRNKFILTGANMHIET